MDKHQPSRDEVGKRLEYCGFDKFRSVEGKTSIDHLYSRHRSGIYVLAFKDGGYYVGLSIAVKSRFKQHLASKPPIAWFTSRAVRKNLQQEYEQHTIDMLREMGARLEENISKTQSKFIPGRRSGKISDEEMRRWMSSDKWNILTGSIPRAPRPSRTELKYKEEFLQLPYANDVTVFYTEYIKKCIFKPKQSAPEKWNVTCLPSGTGYYAAKKNVSVLNVGGQAVVVMGEHKDGEVVVHLSVRKSLFQKHHSREMSKLKKLAPSVTIKKTGLKKLGDDQFDVVVNLKDARNILRDKGLVRSIRALVAHSSGMNQSGSSGFQQFHCYGFAAAILRKV